MTTASTHFKLGLFVLLTALALVLTGLALGIRLMRKEFVQYYTYFDESVSGLETGAPVRYRGVSIGSVGKIEIAPDHRLVAVTLALEAPQVHQLGLSNLPPALRAQIGTQGITGVEFVNLDFVDPKASPPPKLPFEPQAPYIPAAPSMIKGLTEALGAVAERLPVLIDSAVATLERVQVILEEFRGEELPNRLAQRLDEIGRLVADLRGIVRHVDRSGIPEKTAEAIDRLNEAASKVSGLISGLEGKEGLVASTRRATDVIGALGRSTLESTEQLKPTLRDLDEAVQSFNELVRSIERDPDMLLKGRPRTRERVR